MAGGPRSGYSRKPSRTSAALLAAVVVVAFGVRLGVGLSRRDEVYRFGDSQTYRRLAESLASGRGLAITRQPGEVGPPERRADRMPGYPGVLTVLERLFGEATASLVVLQAVLGALTVYLVYLLGREVHSPLAGGAAALAVAVAPWQVYFATVALTECWSAALLAAAVLCAVRAVRRQKAAWAAAAAVAGAALVYIHPGFLGLPVVLLVAAAIAPGRRRWLAYAGLAALIVLASLVPWWIRNARAFGRFVPTTTRLGVSLYDGVRPEAGGGTDMRFEGALAAETADLDEAAYDAYYRQRSCDLIRADPGRMVRLAGAKLGRLWSPVPNASFAQVALYRWSSIAAFVPMLGGALLGLVVMLRRRGALALLLLPVAWVTMVHLVFVGSVRYRVPVEPLLFVLAGAAVAWVARGDVGADER